MAESNAFFGSDGRLRSGWRVAAYFFAFILVAQLLVGGAVGVGLVAYVVLSGARNVDVEQLIHRYEIGMVVAVITLPLLLGLNWLFTRFLDKQTFRSNGLWWDARTLPDLGIGLGFGAGLVALMAVACLIPGWCAFGSPPGLGGMVKGTAIVIFMILGFGAAALNEELIFRGYIQRNLEEGVGPIGAILISGVLFSVVHGLNPNITWLGAVNLFIAGIVLGVVFLRFRSIWAVWTMHFAWNFTMGPVLGVPVSGLVTPSALKVEAGANELTLVSGGAFGFEGGLAATAAMVLFTTLLLIWKGRPARPPEFHPAYLRKMAALEEIPESRPPR
jgi:membrane protease YdiL (CAAX protease family)